jgi:hypothetical protein
VTLPPASSLSRLICGCFASCKSIVRYTCDCMSQHRSLAWLNEIADQWWQLHVFAMHTERLTKGTSLGSTPYHFFVPTGPAAAVPCCTSVHPSGSPRIELSTCCRSVAGLSCARYATPERCEYDAKCSQNYRHGQGQGLLHSIKPGQCRRWSKGSEQKCTPSLQAIVACSGCACHCKISCKCHLCNDHSD